MKKPLLVALVLVAAARPAWPCGGDYDYTPAASVVGYEESGLQPWIAMRNADARNVTLVAATEACPTDERCEGDVVAYDIVGQYIRPSRALPAGTRLQVMFGPKVIGDFTLQASKRTVADWKGLSLSGVDYDPRSGTTTVSMAAPASVDLTQTMTFVYWSRPDPTNPMKNVAEVREGADGLVLYTSRQPRIGIPLQLWVAVADAEGHVSVPQKIL